jgi:NADH-quinone oxidoreductase subunit M
MIAALVVIPILAGLGLYALPRSAIETAKWIGCALSFAIAIAIALLRDAPDESIVWLQRPFAASFHVGLGGQPGAWLALLLALVTGCALALTRIPRQRNFVAQLLILLGAMLGVFLSRDLLLFALFWDFMLVPVFLILIGYTADKSTSSAWKYLIYNLSGGVALLLATAAAGIVLGTTDMTGLAARASAGTTNGLTFAWIFAGFSLAFLVKTPVWPLHTWMPETYADLPAPAAAIVSAVQSKAGLYGFLVIGVPLFTAQMHHAAPLMFVLGLIGLVYGAVIALVSDDLKRVVAYSSLSHLGLILIGIFSLEPIALGGALVYMIAHGLFSAGLFLVAGAVEMREETRSLARLGGLAERNPRLAGAMVIVALAALGLPGLCGFAGEILILTGVYKAGYLWPTLIALVPIVIAAAYMLRVFQGTMHGPERDDLPQRNDLTWIEGLALAPLVVAIVALGVAPGSVVNAVTPPTAAVAVIGGGGTVSQPAVPVPRSAHALTETVR